MKILQNDIKKYQKALEELRYNPLRDGVAYIFFPIEEAYTKNVSGLELSVRNEQYGSGKAIPGIAIIESENPKDLCETALMYADITYAPAIDLKTYISLTGTKLSKKSEELLTENDLDMYIIKKEYVYTILKL